jgi:hypothetical protein
MPQVVTDTRGKSDVATIIHVWIATLNAKHQWVTASGGISCKHVALTGLRGFDPCAERNIRACYVINYAVNYNIISTTEIHGIRANLTGYESRTSHTRRAMITPAGIVPRVAVKLPVPYQTSGVGLERCDELTAMSIQSDIVKVQCATGAIAVNPDSQPRDILQTRT